MKWTSEPLVHFLGLGALLFVAFAWIDRGAVDAPHTRTIVVDADLIADRASAFQRSWQRPPDDGELESLIESWVREEILYREGLALGLDRNDPIIRRRVAQKLEFMSDGAVAEPDEAALEAWLADHPDSYRVPARYAFAQRSFTRFRKSEDLASRVSDALAKLRAGDESVAGDLALLPETVELAAEDQIAGIFGSDFAAALDTLPQHEWAGPVASGYGWHLVRITHKVPAHNPPLADVRTAVERDVIQARTEQAKHAFYRTLRQRYTVRIETDLPTAEYQSRNGSR